MTTVLQKALPLIRRTTFPISSSLSTSSCLLKNTKSLSLSSSSLFFTSRSSFVMTSSYYRRSNHHLLIPNATFVNNENRHQQSTANTLSSDKCNNNTNHINKISRSNNRHKNSQHTNNQKNNNKNNKYKLILLASPMLFTKFDEEHNPIIENIFLTGKTLGSCVEKYFETEYGQSIFMCLLFLALLALFGFEGKVNGFVNRVKYNFSTDWNYMGHRRYVKFLPKNPLLPKDVHQKK